MGTGNSDVGEVSSIKDLLIQRLKNKYVATGDLAAVALARGWSREVRLISNSTVLHIEGKFHFDPLYHVSGFWRLRTWRRKFFMTLPLVSEGYWSLGHSYVKVGQEKIEVVINGETWVSRPNICGMLERMGGDKHVVVHIVGTLRALSAGVYYTAFRCSEWLFPLSREEPMFWRFAFSKKNVYNDITGQPVQFWDVFIKRGRIVKVLVNASCEEYISTVLKLYGVHVKCER